MSKFRQEQRVVLLSGARPQHIENAADAELIVPRGTAGTIVMPDVRVVRRGISLRVNLVDVTLADGRVVRVEAMDQQLSRVKRRKDGEL